MKVAIPLANEKLCVHFGHCEVFALVEVDEEKKTITSQSRLVPPPHEPGLLPRWLHEQGATMIIAGGMGQRAQSIFEQNNITVVLGAPSDGCETIIEQFLNGSLQTGVNMCDH